MAHNISIINGFAEAMFANRPAWHSLGTIFDQGGTTGPDGDTARRLARLSWLVDKQQLFHNGKEVPDKFATVRMDTGDVMGIVGKDYTVQQNHESFAAVDDLVKDGIMRYEAAFALRGGAETVLLARFPQTDEIAEGDHSLRYVAWMNSHDGSSPVIGLPTSVRVVCANTKRLALTRDGSKARKVKHTASMAERIAEVQSYLSQYNTGFTLYRDQASLLATRQVTASGIEDYLNTLFPIKANDVKRTVTRRTNARKSVRDTLQTVSRSEARLIPSIAGTWWELFNAVTYAVDHNKQVTNFHGKGRKLAENQFNSRISGKGSDIKDNAFNLACEMASVTLNHAA